MAKERICPACGIEKANKYFLNLKAEVCTLCEAKGLKPVVVEEPEPVISVDHTQFPAVEVDYNAPSSQELAARILARRNLIQFVRRFRSKYTAGWVHEDIARRLVRFMEAVERGEEPRLLMMLPPRAGKSELGSRNFVPFVLGHHPDWEIIAASHTNSLTLSFSRYIRDLLRDPSYHALFPNTRLDPSSQSVENWNLTGGGGYLAAGVGTGITGRGAHILLLDDLVKDIEAADSQPQRDSVWEWYTSTAYTRLAPGGGVLGIMTWWNEDDWAGRIQQVMKADDGGDVFEIIRYPAINEEGDEYLLANDQIVQLPEGSDIPPDAKMTRPIGTAIHPERYSTGAMTRIKKNLEASGQKRIWSALYQQNPTPDEGIYFSKSMFKEYQQDLSRMNVQIYQAWDFAITEGTQNDWTVGITVLQDAYDDLYVLDINRFRSGDGENIMNIVVQYAQDWNVNVLGVEDGQIWKALETTFTRICAAKKFYPSYEKLKPLTDKLVRAQPLRGRMQAGKVFFPTRAPWYTELKNELLRFPAGKHDDQVDALAWVVRLVLTKSAPQAQKPKEIASWRDKLRQMQAGGRGGAMAA